MTPDILAKKIDSLTRNCLQLQQALSGFEVVLDRENAAIGRSDINELEAITQEKIAFGMAVEDKSQKIRHSIDEFAQLYALENHSEQALQIDDLLVYLQREVAHGSVSDSLHVAMDRLAKQINGLVEERKKIFPKVEANAYLVRKLLQYHRETYAFWQAVASESEAVYSKAGRAVSPAKKSILTVRT